MRLGLVESILQLGDAPPTIAAYYSSSFLDGCLLLRLLLMLLMKLLLNVLFLESDFGFWRCVLWLFLLLLLMMIVVVLIVVTPIIAVPKVLLPDVVLVEIDFVLVVVFFVFVVLVRRDVPILRVAAVLRADRPRGRFVVELLGVAALLFLLLLIRRRVRDQLRRTELDDGGGIRGGGTQ